MVYTAADADAIFKAYNEAFYVADGNGGYYRNTTDGDRAAFWQQAEEMEMVLDVYERTTNATHLGLFRSLYGGFIQQHGTNWESNPYNDDLMWMVIACSRACLLTGDPAFRSVAQSNFDLVFARAWSTNLGGGLYWSTTNTSKNACVNGPGAIAAYLLYQSAHDPSYLAKATSLYQWERATLFNATSGAVYDHIRTNGIVDYQPMSYNQGTFIGAAHLLGFTNDAALAASFTMNRLGVGGLLPQYGERSDGGGFNGICVRWLAKFMRERGRQATCLRWLQANANAAWDVRRTSDNLSWCRWHEPTPLGRRFSWGCSSSVVVLQAVPAQTPGTSSGH